MTLCNADSCHELRRFRVTLVSWFETGAVFETAPYSGVRSPHTCLRDALLTMRARFSEAPRE